MFKEVQLLIPRSRDCQFIIERAMKKINKTKMPSWIEYIRIDEVDVGTAPPT
jgi:hypothetical protein